ncbi:MAG: YheT family hydrolase [Alphaproteobacteria bacterium]
MTGVLHPGGGSAKPLAILLHGLTGCTDSFYLLNTARHLLALGYPVLRLNWRSAGSSRAGCTQEYHAGRSQDLREAIAALPVPWRHRTKIAVGYSLGGNILLKYLGEEGAASAVAAAVSISAPMDLAAAGARFRQPRNFLYHRFILRSMKRDLARGKEPVDAALLKAGLEARTLREFDDRYIAPRYGFHDADDYYGKSSANRHIGGIRVPTLVIHAGDDPWIPAVIYKEIDWSGLPTCRLLLPKSGGHVGFHGAGTQVPWTDRCVEKFLSCG